MKKKAVLALVEKLLKSVEQLDDGDVKETFMGAGKVTRMGNSRCIPLSAYIAKLYGDVAVGDAFQFWDADGELIIRFPKIGG